MPNTPQIADLAILNAQLVNEGSIRDADVLVKDGRISAITAPGSVDTGGCKRIIDAQGKHLLPGIIDDQVHFREPGMTDKADIHHESRAAVVGGTTTFMEMPNTNPTTTTYEALEDKYAIAAREAVANHAFYFGASNENLELVKALDPQSACGLKVFMGSSTGDMLVDDAAVLSGIFAASPLLVATHCEHTPSILANEAAAHERWGKAVPPEEHPNIRHRDACYRSSSLAVELAKQYNTRLHILHLTTAEELDLFTAGPIGDKRITAEACVHHLWFCDEDYARLGHQIKCNPAIKTTADRAALRQAVLDDRIDVIATDHAPHTWAEKDRDYFGSPSGLPLVQHSLQMLLDLHHQGVFSLERIVHKTSHAVADRFEIRDRGYVREGYWADLVLVDLDAANKANNPPVAPENIRAKCGWSPLTGHQFQSCIEATIVSGHPAWVDGQLDDSVAGKRLDYDR